MNAELKELLVKDVIPTPENTRKTAAAMLGRSPRLIDLLANRGVLPRVTLPGRVRAAGFRRSDVVALIKQ